MRPCFRVIAALLGCALASQASAHSRLDPAFTPKPRDPSTGLKTDPCGGVAATTNDGDRAQLVAGSTMTIHWQESILHAGYFIIDLSTDGDQTFTQYVLGNNLDPKDDAATAAMQKPNFNDPSTYLAHQTQVTIPDIDCAHCTLRLRQFMSDTNTYYHSCADVAITRNATVTPPTGGAKPPAPTGLKVNVKDLSP